MQLGKLAKWGLSSVRVVVAKPWLASRLQLHRCRKTLYLGQGVHLMVEPDGRMEVGTGASIEYSPRLQVRSYETICVWDYVYMTTKADSMVSEFIEMGTHAMADSNICTFNHDNYAGGVRCEQRMAPVHLDKHFLFWFNALVSRGVAVVHRILSGNMLSRIRSSSRKPMSAIQRGSSALLPRRTVA
jgi:hypothetical protein